MKRIVNALLCLSVLTGRAQSPDSAAQMADAYFKEAAAASQHQSIWPAPLYGPMLFVDPETRITYANEPDSAGIFKQAGDIYTGVLPKDVMIANTEIHWSGKHWSVILWPLPPDRNERVNLMVHESFHRIQDNIGLPERSPTADHLSTMNGRIYFLLELQALKAALNKPINQRAFDLTSALIFREKRQALFPATFENERILDMSEGLAEYTGVILGREPNTILQHLNDQIDTARNRESLIRSAAYITGPVYGYLLYEKSPGWSLNIDSNADFPALIEKYYQIPLPKPPSDKHLAVLENTYGGELIIHTEKLKEEKRLQIFSMYTDRFVRKRVLTIQLINMSIEFNPNTMFDLGEYGTVYPTAHIKDSWGQLTVTSNGMLLKDWKQITLPAENYIENGRSIEGKGWTIQLRDHWEMVKTDPTHFILINKTIK